MSTVLSRAHLATLVQSTNVADCTSVGKRGSKTATPRAAPTFLVVSLIVGPPFSVTGAARRQWRVPPRRPEIENPPRIVVRRLESGPSIENDGVVIMRATRARSAEERATTYSTDGWVAYSSGR